VTIVRPYPGTPPGPHTLSVVAHRGASEEAPEHTLAAYRRAIEDGADALECDVRLTADGQLVCVHDRRINRTSNGRGAVSSLELSDLAALDFGSWKGQAADTEAPDRNSRDSTAVLTLERLLQLVADAGRRVELAIETKHPTRWAGRVEEQLLALLRRYGLAGPPSATGAAADAWHSSAADTWHSSAPAASGGAPAGERPPAGGAPAGEQSAGRAPGVRVMSFSARSLQRVRAAAPAIPTVYLMQFVLPRHRDGQLPPGVRIAGPSIRIVRNHPDYVARLHRAGHRVHVWTVDDPADVDLCVRLGVDAIITNRPRQVLSQLGRG
jgi:glycerophosphoryl diester phosphodiesterase